MQLLGKATKQAYSSVSQIVTNLWYKTLPLQSKKHLEMNDKDLVEDLPKISHESEVCKTYQQGKQIKLPFQKNQWWKANQKLQLINTNVCGPMKIKSFNDIKN